MDFFDLVATAGLLMLAAGLWMLAPWISLTVTGSLLLVGGFLAARLAVVREALDDRRQGG